MAGDESEAEEEAPPEPELVVRVKVTENEQLKKQKEAERMARALAKQEAAEEQEGGEGNDAGENEQEEPKLEDLGMSFDLRMFDGVSVQSEIINDSSFVFEHRMPIPMEEAVALAITENELVCMISVLDPSSDAPVVVLPINIHHLIGGDLEVSQTCSLASTRLALDPFNLVSFTITCAANKDVLDEETRQKLNPLTVTICEANQMPSRDTSGREASLSDMHSALRPAFCKYTFLGRAVETNGVLQEKKLVFDHRQVFCLGMKEPLDVMEYMLHKELLVEIRDREKAKTDEATMSEPLPADEATPEGEETTEEKKLNPDIVKQWSGLKRIDRERATQIPPPPQFGLVRVKLADMVREGSRRIVATPEISPMKEENAPKYAVSFHNKQYPSAFIECGSTMTVKLSLSHPLEQVCWN